MYGWKEQNNTVVHFDRITANLFCATDYISCLKLLIIKLLIEKLKYINWKLLLLLENSDIDSQWYNGRFKLSIFRAVPGF